MRKSQKGSVFFLADNGTPSAYTPNILNQYAETSNGSVHEVFAYQNVSYHYLGDTRLARVSSSTAGLYELGYDALGRCVRRTSNGVSTYYIYDGERPIIEFNASCTITARNTYGMGMDEILARDAGALYYHQDRLGNVSAVTDAEGKVVEQYRYDAFGQPEIRGGPVPGNANGALTGTPGNNVTQVNNRFLFTGREWVANYGFYEYRNRAYNPALGRFMSEDPLGFKAGDRNLFRYCGGDPVNRMDPMGLSDLNYVPQWDPRYNDVNWDREYYRIMHGETKGKMVVVSAHGGPNYVMNSNVTQQAFDNLKKGIAVPASMRLDVKQLVGDIKKLDNYTATKPIRLDICYAGRGGDRAVAQQVANGLITNTVTANTDVVRADNGKGGGEWRDFNSPESKRATNVVNASVRSYQDKSGQSSLGNGEGSSNEVSTAPSARDVDLAHQATGVPSLGAEAVNFARGPR